MKTLQLGDIQIETDGQGGGTIIRELERETCPECGDSYCSGTCNKELTEGESRILRKSMFHGAMAGIESFILALACEGVNIETNQFEEALGTALDACANNL